MAYIRMTCRNETTTLNAACAGMLTLQVERRIGKCRSNQKISGITSAMATWLVASRRNGSLASNA